MQCAEGIFVVGGCGLSGEGRGSKALNCVNIAGVAPLRGPWRVICRCSRGRAHACCYDCTLLRLHTPTSACQALLRTCG